MRRTVTTLLAVLAIVMLCASLSSAQNNGAMLYANGDVKVNGQAAGYSTSIYSGDKVEATSAAAGSINRSGSSVVVSPNSSIQYDAASIELLQGSARVSTSKGMSAKIGDVVVSPKDANAKFDVTRNGDKVVVASRGGSLTVRDGNQTTTVAPGASTELALAGNAPVVASETNQTNFLSDRLAEHPFYGVVNGVEAKPPTLPICSSLQTCIRPSVSMIRPCCCPPRIMCN